MKATVLSMKEKNEDLKLKEDVNAIKESLNLRTPLEVIGDPIGRTYFTRCSGCDSERRKLLSSAGAQVFKKFCG